MSRKGGREVVVDTGGGGRRGRDGDSGGSGGQGRNVTRTGKGRERVDFDEEESMEITTNAEVEVFSTFDSMGLKEDLLRGIYEYGKRFIQCADTSMYTCTHVGIANDT
jgi:hypothetical protein